MNRRRAFITGVTGQDGTYLSELLYSRGYEVHGVDAPGHAPRRALASFEGLDLRDRSRLAAYLARLAPDECYHLAAYHHSSSARGTADEGEEERLMIETNLLSAQTILQTLSTAKPDCRVFLAGSCHMFGHAPFSPQNEQTPFAPTNAYAIAKTAATQLGRLYRGKGRFVCTGILFNHESPLRTADFVTGKIARAAVDIAQGKTEQLTLGNLDARVDWGFAGDYVEAMNLMLRAEFPEDFVIATGELHSVRDFVETAFSHVGLDWTRYVTENAGAYRPVSQSVYCGDISAIKNRLGWQPKTSFQDLVHMMVDGVAREP